MSERIDNDDIGCLHVERPDDDRASMVDNLSVVLCTYFYNHDDRPDTDLATEHEDNCYWGEWVTRKTDEALSYLSEQINAKQQKCKGASDE